MVEEENKQSRAEIILPTKNLKIGAILGTILSCGCFGYGIRLAYLQSRPIKRGAELTRYQLLSGFGFATKAFTIATLITCSGYSLLVFSVSLALNVTTPSQFGQKMKKIFSDRYRIKGSENSVQFEEIFKDS